MTTNLIVTASGGQQTPQAQALPSDMPPPLPSLDALRILVERDKARAAAKLIGAGAERPPLVPAPKRLPPPLTEAQKQEAEKPKGPRLMTAEEVAALKEKQADMARRMSSLTAQMAGKDAPPPRTLTGLLSHIVRGQKQKRNGIDG